MLKKCTQILFFFFLFSFFFSGCGSRNTIKIYVSVEGNDDSRGNITEPLASISAAVNKVRDLRKSGNTNPATIYLREGLHQLNQTLVLGIEDGRISTSDFLALDKYGAGKNIESPFLTFAAYPGERPIVSGGIPIDGWELLKTTPENLPIKAVGKVWVTDIPEGIEKFYTLYDAKGRLNRARGKGFAPTKPGDKRTFYFPEGALKNWDNLSDIEINIRPGQAWMINMLPLESVDEEKGVAKTAVTATYEMNRLAGWVHTEDGSSAWVENTLEALDEPSEWVVNTKTRKIYLWPANNGAPQDILAPTTSELIRVEGEIDYDGPEDNPVCGIAFTGITFTQADRRAWTSDEDRLGWGMQHDWDLFDRPTAMLRFRGAEECEVNSCNFINSGGAGVRFDLHAQRNRVENCEFAHLGEAGVLLAGYGLGTKDVNHHNDIINNHIHHFSEITWHSPGIWAWQSGYNHIAHNYVHHSGYASILITNRVEPNRYLNGEGGRTIRQHEIPEDVKINTKITYENWKVREKYNHSRHNLIEYNELTNAVQKLSDGNAIYVSGAGKGNIIRYNFLHDNLSQSMPETVRCDDDQHETLIFGNVFYNNYSFYSTITSKGINDIINNFIVAPQTVPNWGYISFEWVPVTGSKAYNNVIISHPDGGSAYAERPRTPGHPKPTDPTLSDVDMDSNLYYHPTNQEWMDEHFIRMRALGKEKESVFADPMFVDPSDGDFSFKEGSPAFKLGIEALDVSKMGLLKE